MSSFEQKPKPQNTTETSTTPSRKSSPSHAPQTHPPRYLQDLSAKDSSALSNERKEEGAADNLAHEILEVYSTPQTQGDHRPGLTEQRLASDFPEVQLHSDRSSARHASALGARAFTIGHDIRFGEGELQPNTQEGQHLLAHELAHVVQQEQSGQLKIQRARLLDWADDRTAEVSDDDIRTSNEYKAFMDPSLVWQTQDRVTEAEAIQACRFILAALRNGITVNWEADARSYMERARAYIQQVEDLAVEQQTWVETEAMASGLTAGEYMHNVAQTGGYGGGPTPWWDSLSALDRLAWFLNANLVIESVKTSVAGTDLETMVNTRGIIASPRECESLNAYAYFSSSDNHLHVGREWIEVADNDPLDVHDNIAHELGGHFEYAQYGEGMAHSITAEVLSNLPPAEADIATMGPRNLYTAYAYPETEIFAELREYDLKRPLSQGDRPENDVPRQLRAIRDRFAPRVAEAIVTELRARVQEAANISDAAKALFDESIHDVFPGLLPL